MTSASRLLFKGEPAVLLDDGGTAAVVLPKRGAKIASLTLRPRHGSGEPVESLAQAPGGRYRRPVGYGMAFEGEDGTGFDDMCPCIAPCTLGSEPFRGTQLPDHGEVWALPWEARLRGGQLTCAVHGIRLPYSLRKTVSLADGQLQVCYQARNHAPFPLPFQWAAHAILQINPGSRLLAPAGMHRILNAYAGNRLPDVGRQYTYPRPDSSSPFDLSLIPERNGVGAQKYWFAGPVSEGACGLLNPATGLTTTIRFSRETLPYLGIWVNEGGWNGCYNVGIEPSTCILDDPLASAARGVEAVLPPRGELQWQITIELHVQAAAATS
jgi:hypothetical protein